jgi:hypothetical protein
LQGEEDVLCIFVDYDLGVRLDQHLDALKLLRNLAKIHKSKNKRNIMAVKNGVFDLVVSMFWPGPTKDIDVMSSPLSSVEPSLEFNAIRYLNEQTAKTNVFWSALCSFLVALYRFKTAKHYLDAMFKAVSTEAFGAKATEAAIQMIETAAKEKKQLSVKNLKPVEAFIHDRPPDLLHKVSFVSYSRVSCD